MAIKEGIVAVVANTKGIKIEGEDKWINASKAIEASLDADKMKNTLKGKLCIITLDEKGFYTAIQVSDKQPHQASKPMGERTIQLNGKTFVTHQGLLDVAHREGLVSIETTLMTPVDSPTAIVKAKVTMIHEKKDTVMTKTYEAHGDASAESLKPNMVSAKIRMAETRAVNRALRFATNIGMTSADELDGKANEPNEEAPSVEEEVVY